MINCTLFVDPIYGSDFMAKPNSINYPFKSIAAALSIISEAPLLQIRLSPGHYNEYLNLIYPVDIVGSGIGVTSILGIKAINSGSVRDLTIISSKTLTIDICLDKPNTHFCFSNIRFQATLFSGTIVSIVGSGMNSRVDFDTCWMNALDSRVGNQCLFNIETICHLKNMDIEYLASHTNKTTIFNINSICSIVNSSVSLKVNDGPSRSITLISTGKKYPSFLNIMGLHSTINIMQLNNPYQASINYIKSHSNDKICLSSSMAFLDSIDINFCNLLYIKNNQANIQLLSLSLPDITVPKIKGSIDCVSYNITTKHGLNTNACIYNTVKTLSLQEYPHGYYVQESDYSLLTTTDIYLYDPRLANQKVTSIGKIIYITNTGTSDIKIYGQDNTFKEYILKPNMSIQLQNTPSQWYKI